jgi:hypothetical protein
MGRRGNLLPTYFRANGVDDLALCFDNPSMNTGTKVAIGIGGAAAAAALYFVLRRDDDEEITNDQEAPAPSALNLLQEASAGVVREAQRRAILVQRVNELTQASLAKGEAISLPLAKREYAVAHEAADYVPTVTKQIETQNRAVEEAFRLPPDNPSRMHLMSVLQPMLTALIKAKASLETAHRQGVEQSRRALEHRIHRVGQPETGEEPAMRREIREQLPADVREAFDILWMGTTPARRLVIYNSLGGELSRDGFVALLRQYQATLGP